MKNQCKGGGSGGQQQVLCLLSIYIYVLSYLIQCLYEVGIVFIIPFLYILLYLLFVKKLRLEVECLASKKTRV